MRSFITKPLKRDKDFVFFGFRIFVILFSIMAEIMPVVMNLTEAIFFVADVMP